MKPVCLSIGGSDSCAGAGIQADLRVFESLGVKGCTAITALTAQNPREITRIEAVPLAQLDAELHAVFDYYEVAAVKTGMLADAEHVAVVAAALNHFHAGKPLVVDPVMIASSGMALLDKGGGSALIEALLPQATLVTPNLHEASCWLNHTVSHANDDALTLAKRFGIAVLLKGGHGQGSMLNDVLAMPDGSVEKVQHARKAWDNEQAHGTGCRLAAAIAAHLAAGKTLIDAVRKGIAINQKAT